MDNVITIRTGGVDFHARQLGGRPRAVFLHGFGGDLHTWDGVWSVLGENLPALRYDLRGFGQTLCESEASFNHAADLLALLDAAEIRQCDLIGVSMGGGVALNFALDHPERIRNLVLVSPALVAWEWSEGWREWWRPIVERARAGKMDEARRLWWRHPLFATTRKSRARQALYDSIMRFSGSQWVHDNHEMVPPDVERLHLLRTRTLLLTGGRDLEDFRLIADLIEASVPDVERVDLPACGHMLHLEEPVVCADRILTFVTEGGRL